MKLTEKILSKWFGSDDSDGHACDCNECNIRNHILENQEIIEKTNELRNCLDDGGGEGYAKNRLQEILKGYKI